MSSLQLFGALAMNWLGLEGRKLTLDRLRNSTIGLAWWNGKLSLDAHGVEQG